MKIIDVTGLSCPEPVVRTQAALKTLPAGETLNVLVDTVTARENVSRAARAAGCEVRVESHDRQFSLTLTRSS